MEHDTITHVRSEHYSDVVLRWPRYRYVKRASPVSFLAKNIDSASTVSYCPCSRGPAHHTVNVGVSSDVSPHLLGSSTTWFYFICTSYWSSLAHSATHTNNLTAWFVNRDVNGELGAALRDAIGNSPKTGRGSLGWVELSLEQAGSDEDITNGIVREGAWIAVVGEMSSLSLFFWSVPSSSCLYYFCLLNTVLTHHSTRFILNLRYKLFMCTRNSTTSFLKNSHLKYQRWPLYIWCSSTYSMIVLIFLVSSNASFALDSARRSGDTNYDPSNAITVYYATVCIMSSTLACVGISSVSCRHVTKSRPQHTSCRSPKGSFVLQPRCLLHAPRNNTFRRFYPRTVYRIQLP